MSPAVDPLAAEHKQVSQNCSNVLLILPTEREPPRICANDIDKTHPREAHPVEATYVFLTVNVSITDQTPRRLLVIRRKNVRHHCPPRTMSVPEKRCIS
jgi:hypothetical protein